MFFRIRAGSALHGTRLATDQAIAYARRYGSQGPASPCRRIDPVSGQVIEVIEARQPGERKARSRQAPC
jgi:hypothetical protein